jgi:hypothetical protein
MNAEELEDLFIKSLDTSLSEKEQDCLSKELQTNTGLSTQINQHSKLRALLSAKERASFGPYFAGKLINRIQSTGVIIDRQLFDFFSKFQLAAIGVIIALLAVNLVLSKDNSLSSIMGIESSVEAQEEINSFDFYHTLNNDL